MKGIVLAEGTGTRLFPITKGISKQLIPIYDKPKIFYPLSTLKLAGIRDILLKSAPQDLLGFRKLLSNGSQFGIHLEYAECPSPDGLTQTMIISEEFIGNDTSCLALEKSKTPKSNYAIAELYFYPSGGSELAKQIQPSTRGELKITTLNQMYLLHKLGRGFAWLGIGTIDSSLRGERIRRSDTKTIRNTGSLPGRDRLATRLAYQRATPRHRCSYAQQRLRPLLHHPHSKTIRQYSLI